jgi:FkbM family methyltransferase
LTIRLPWGLPIRVEPRETIGSSIGRLGIHELPTSECIIRLIDSGDTTIDAGANIGHMTSLMAVAAGPTGRVIAFEPHPTIFRELAFNVEAWKTHPGVAKIETHNTALADHSGTADLLVPRYFADNHGVAYLVDDSNPVADADLVKVRLGTLDELIGTEERIGVLKIDVEGHELQVLHGARALLASGNVHQVVFEEYGTPPTPVTSLLESHGYTLFRVDGNLSGLVVLPAHEKWVLPVKDAPIYVATLEPQRLQTRLAKRGWTVYSSSGGH